MNKQMQTVVVGGGQAGLALSYYLSQAGRDHVVLEKAAQPGSAWRNGRWDSFTLVTPNWSFRLPGANYAGPDRDGFMSREQLVSAFEQYQANHHLPVQHDTEVLSVTPDENEGYILQTRVNGQTETVRAQNVVIATGLYQRSRIPSFAKAVPAAVLQLHSGEYCNPQALPPGAVLVIGAGQSGGQIAEELHESGRKVYLSIGFAPLTPRRYRGKDIYHWADQTGFLSRTVDQLPSPAQRFISNPLLSGKNGGHAMNPHQFYRAGITLLGRVIGYEAPSFHFAPDLKENLTKSDAAGANFCGMIDRYIQQNQLAAPEEKLNPLSDGYQAPIIESLDLQALGISVVIWANGYSADYGLVRLPVTDAQGFPVTQRGVTRFPGLYFLGMFWLHTPRSGLLLGVGDDAEYLAGRIGLVA